MSSRRFFRLFLYVIMLFGLDLSVLIFLNF
jgi:hypothetical protein